MRSSQTSLPLDAAIREVKEATGLLVHHSKILGRRLHPRTGRTIIYLGCSPVEGTDIFVGDAVHAEGGTFDLFVTAVTDKQVMLTGSADDEDAAIKLRNRPA